MASHWTGLCFSKDPVYLYESSQEPFCICKRSAISLRRINSRLFFEACLQWQGKVQRNIIWFKYKRSGPGIHVNSFFVNFQAVWKKEQFSMFTSIRTIWYTDTTFYWTIGNIISTNYVLVRNKKVRIIIVILLLEIQLLINWERYVSE